MTYNKVSTCLFGILTGRKTLRKYQGLLWLPVFTYLTLTLFCQAVFNESWELGPFVVRCNSCVLCNHDSGLQSLCHFSSFFSRLLPRYLNFSSVLYFMKQFRSLTPEQVHCGTILRSYVFCFVFSSVPFNVRGQNVNCSHCHSFVTHYFLTLLGYRLRNVNIRQKKLRKRIAHQHVESKRKAWPTIQKESVTNYKH